MDELHDLTHSLLIIILGSSPSQVGRVCTAMIFFCTPAHRSAQACTAGSGTSFFRHRSSSPRPARPGEAVSACLRGGIGCCCFRMRVREPVHGMQGLGKGRSLRLYPNSARLWSGPMRFLGTHLGLRPRPAGRCALLRPKAEFARSSGRGLRWVKKSIVAPASHYRGSDPQGSCNSNRSLCARSWIKDAKGMCKNPQATRRNSQTRAALTDKELLFRPLNKGEDPYFIISSCFTAAKPCSSVVKRDRLFSPRLCG